MVSPYWIADAPDLWMEGWDVMRGDYRIVHVRNRADAERVLLELNRLWFTYRS